MIKPNAPGDDPISKLEFEPHSFRRFSTRPSGIFVDEVVQHINETGQPETHPALYRNRLSRDVRYTILRKVHIPKGKRPAGDLAPCPMCTPNRFLEGVIAYCHEVGVVSVIGRCCAVNADEAEREFRKTEKLRAEEDYLLAAMPHLAAKRATLETLRGPATEAQLMYRAFRRKVPTVHARLRDIASRKQGRLVLTEVIGDGATDVLAGGPRGLGRGDVDSRDHEFGYLGGTTALLSNYRPLTELDDAIRSLDSFDFAVTEEEALDRIAEFKERERRAAVAICDLVDKSFEKLTSRLDDFAAFWSRDNIERIGAFGASEFNHDPFEARFAEIGAARRPTVVIRHGREEFRMQVSPALFDTSRPWTSFQDLRRR